MDSEYDIYEGWKIWHKTSRQTIATIKGVTYNTYIYIQEIIPFEHSKKNNQEQNLQRNQHITITTIDIIIPKDFPKE